MARSDRIDEVASPLRYGGHGPSVELRFQSAGARVDASLRGGFSALRSNVSDRRATLTDGALAVIMFPGVTPERESRAAFGMSAQLAASVVAHPHDGAATSAYGFGTLTVGPTLRLSRPVAGGRADVGLTTPLLGLVAQSYSTISAAKGLAGIHSEFATPASLRAGAATLSFVPRSSFRIEYRVGAQHYVGAQPVRALTQSLSIGVQWR
jgi:hypothetical protein